MCRVQRIKTQSEEEKRAQELYPLVYPPGWEEKSKKTISNGADPSVTTNAILDALTSPYPHVRYPVAGVNRKREEKRRRVEGKRRGGRKEGKEGRKGRRRHT